VELAVVEAVFNLRSW